MSGVLIIPDMTSLNIPLPPTDVPLAEGVAPAIGDPLRYASDKHVHARLSSATYATTNGSGLATVTFTRVFAAKPIPVFSVENSDGVTCTVTAWQQDGNGNYTGCTFRATRRTAGVGLVSTVVALVSVITGVTATTTDTPVSGATCSVLMIQRSDPA